MRRFRLPTTWWLRQAYGGGCILYIQFEGDSRGEEGGEQDAAPAVETRQAQMFMGTYNQLVSKDFMSAYWKIMNIQWKNYDEYQELFKDPEFQTAAYYVGGYYEGLGVLVREGLLDIRWIALLICGMTREWWEKLKTQVVEMRKETGQPRMAARRNISTVSL